MNRKERDHHHGPKETHVKHPHQLRHLRLKPANSYEDRATKRTYIRVKREKESHPRVVGSVDEEENDIDGLQHGADAIDGHDEEASRLEEAIESP